MNQVLKYRNEIYGFLALWILFFHIETRIGMPDIPIITTFVGNGNFSVDVFLFLSGFCLALSLGRNPDTKTFYKKRFNRVLWTYLIIAIPFFLWKCFAEFPSKHALHFMYDLSGLSFWLSGVQNAWFVDAILFFYIITPPIYKFVKVSFQRGIILLIAIYALLVIAHYTVPFVHRFEIASTRLPVFVMGMIMACHNPDFELPMNKWITALFIMLSITILYLVPGHLTGFWWWMLYALMVIPALWILRACFSIAPQIVRKVFSSWGGVSLEIYLIHIMTLHVFTWYELNGIIGAWLYLLLPAIALPLSFVVPKISSVVLSKKAKYKQK